MTASASADGPTSLLGRLTTPVVVGSRRLMAPVVVGSRRLPSIGLVIAAAVGAFLLVVVATTEWRHLNDEYAYWLAGSRFWAGEPLYDVAAAPNTPYAYWYPPPLAQVLGPLTAVLSPDAFSVAWTALLLACLWWLGGRNVLVGLALVAFLPVAVELRVRNVHLLIAVLAVLGLRRHWAFWIPAAAIKITPVLGIGYLAAAGRRREAVLVAVVGAVVLAVSVVLAPGAWREFLSVVGARAGTDGGSWLPIPFAVRFLAGAVLALVAGRVAGRAAARGASPRIGESLLIVALVIANPTLWATALSMLVAIVPLWRTAAPLAVVAEARPVAADDPAVSAA